MFKPLAGVHSGQSEPQRFFLGAKSRILALFQCGRGDVSFDQLPGFPEQAVGFAGNGIPIDLTAGRVRCVPVDAGCF